MVMLGASYEEPAILDSRSKGRHSKRGQEGTHTIRVSLLRLTLDHLGRADRTRARGRGRTLGGRRALHLGTTRSGAGRALTPLLSARTVVHNDWLGLRDTGFEDILAQIRSRRALRLQHILCEIRHSRARRNTGLENIFAQIRFSAGRARRADRS